MHSLSLADKSADRGKSEQFSAFEFLVGGGEKEAGRKIFSSLAVWRIGGGESY